MTQEAGAAVEAVARALYACEKGRSDRCDAMISAAAGKTVKVGMEPWEECWQTFHGDARAAIAAYEATLRPAIEAGDYRKGSVDGK